MKLIFQAVLDSFAEEVKDFCNWAESDLSQSFDELKIAEEYLVNLHLKILKLPEANSIWSEVEDLKEVEKDKSAISRDWAECKKKFEKLPFNQYWEIFDSSKFEDNEPVLAMLADDLADIYSDLKVGLLLYEKGMFPEAFWEWKFNFQIHWGSHLVGAQKAIRDNLSANTKL